MRYLVLLIATLFSATLANSAILEGHPRVWIDSTIKSRLQADAAANTQVWQDLKNYCDSNLATNNSGSYRLSGYHFNDWYTLVVSYGLCFQATGDQAYGNEGVVYMTGLLRDNADSGVIGDGLGGDLEIRTDSGYVSRSAGTGVAIGRDWLDGATNLTPELIAEATARMATWWNWISVNAHAINDPRDNYFYGHLAMVYTAAFSFHGDTGYQDSWLTAAETKWNTQVLPLVNGGYYDGGDDAKGWNYSPWAYEEMVGYMLARDTATDEANPWADSNIHEDLAKSQVHFLYPNRGQFSDNGMWSADIKGDPRSSLSRFLAAMTPIDPTRKGTLKWYADNLTYEPNDPAVWKKFLYRTSDITPVPPTALNMGGLSYTTNIGHLVARSDGWANQEASLVEMFAYIDRKPINNSATNGDYNVGDMRFFSRGISLVADGDREQYTGHYQNQLLVTGSHTYAPFQEPWLYGKSGVTGYPQVSLKTGEGTGYAYGKIKNAQNAYDGTYWTNTPSLAHYDRSMLTIWPDTVIVYDNVTAKSSSNDVSVRWWFPRQPTVSGQTLSTTDQEADLKVSVIGITGEFAAPGTSYDLMAITGTSTYRPGYYFADFQTTGTPINNQMITVMQATDHGVSPSGAAGVAATGGKGASIGGNTVVIFTASQTGGDIADLEYTADATTHYICDLPVNSNVEVFRSGESIGSFDTGDVGVINFTAVSGEAIYTIGEPVVIPDTCDATHLNLCPTPELCATVTPIAYWYDNACHSEPEPVVPPVSTGITFGTGGTSTFGTGGSGSLGVLQ